MKKIDLTSLAMIGISAGLVVGGCQNNHKHNDRDHNQSNGEQMSPDMQAFYASLSSKGQKEFEELDAQHKMMAVEMANQECNGKNSCKEMGGCATADNACAGKNDCKGKGGPPVKDPNQAVEVQYKNQMQQRQEMQSKMNDN